MSTLLRTCKATFLQFQNERPPTCKSGTLIRPRQKNATGIGRLRRCRRRGVIAAAAPPRAGMEALQKGIAELYDESSGIWEDLWGDHMHHGFYDPDVPSSISDHRSAQIRMVEEALRFAGISEDPVKRPMAVVDVGCGIGGSSRYLAKKYGAKCHGITLSPVQAQMAQSLSSNCGLADRVSFQVADALNLPFPDGQFDLVWSMESGEHMPDKAKDIKAADWSEYVAPFWPAVIRSALTWKGLTSLLRSGWKTIKGALAMPWMIEGYKKDLIKFAIITCQKPELIG
ncbi:probable tocopherol O-methyltransferase, chloroplastic isoform X2 [Macadamia integrifolia]|uniref:probable tocopherol O-methyltransferase, chloroplastic isoform X2 n=1 Tax=Macadamia integrifolia TaxID=60698 RepID=UPI001C4EEFAD|nr:probable tocopherol O-methyltransferase, chloroplastic isoform X2 [Macadamia integrifolia]